MKLGVANANGALTEGFRKMTKPIEELESLIPYLRRYARSLVRDADRADDLVQDTLVKAIDNIDRFSPGTNMRAWLFTILINTFKSQRRTAIRRGPHLAWDDLTDQLSGPPRQEHSQEMRLFAKAIAELPDHERQTLLLVGLEGFSYEEAAGVLGIEIGTVKSRVSRARTKLRRFHSQEPETLPQSQVTAADDTTRRV